VKRKTKKKFLITGGAGFIGFHLAHRILREPDAEVILVDNFRRGQLDRGLKELLDHGRTQFIECDLSDRGAVLALPRAHVVFHLAAVVGVQNVVSSPGEVLRTNVLGAFNCLEYVRGLPDCERLVFSSTSEVYAGALAEYGIKIPTPEITPLVISNLKKPRGTYAVSKMVGEMAMLMEALAGDLQVTVVRYHNIYGPRMGLSHVIPEMIVKCCNGGAVAVASPDHTRAFCFITDAVDATLALSKAAHASGEIYNIGNPQEEIKIWELAMRINAMCKARAQLERGGVTPGSPERRSPDIAKLTGTTGFTPKVPLEEGLYQTLDWYSREIGIGVN